MSIDRYPWLLNFKNKYDYKNFPSAIIIEGEFGLAKNKLAKYLAQKLLCTEDLSPCGECNSCNYFLAETHPDYCFLDRDTCSSILYSFKPKNSNSKDIVSNKIDGIRALNGFLDLTNSTSKKRISILFNAHLMNQQSQNGLLKTLEELPQNKHIILVSNRRRHFLPTIYSRSNLISINNPDSESINRWITDQGYIDFSTLNFEPDLAPLAIEKLINNDQANQYERITKKINSFCVGEITSPDLQKFLKELNISFEDKINSIILYLKTCIGINNKFYKSHPFITSISYSKLNNKLLSDLIEELIDYKVSLNQVSTLNEQIGLSYFFNKIRELFR